MNAVEQKLANKTKMLAYWQNEINSKGADKTAIQAAIDRLEKEILLISGGIAPQNLNIASEAKQSCANSDLCHGGLDPPSPRVQVLQEMADQARHDRT